MDIKENEEQYILRLDNFSFVELVDIKPENPMYIHSITEPFNDEMQMDYQKLLTGMLLVLIMKH